MPQNYVMPANSILIHGVPLWEEFEAAPGSAILPGDLVEFDTRYCADGEAKIMECAEGSEDFLGVAEQSHAGDADDAFSAGDQVRVMSGDIIVRMRLEAGNEVTCGDLLKPAASGEIQPLDCEAGTHDPADNPCLLAAQARASYSSATLVQWVIVKFMR